MVKDRDAYEDYLVDKAKELLHEQDDSGTDAADPMEQVRQEPLESDNDRKRRIADEQLADTADADGSGSAAPEQDVERVRSEAEFLARKREHMDNNNLKDFLAGTSEFHEQLRESGRPQFSDWEKRLLLTHRDASAEELAEELDRSVDDIKLQQKLMGLDTGGPTEGIM